MLIKKIGQANYKLGPPLAELNVSGYTWNDTYSEAVTSSGTEPESSSTVITIRPCCPLTKSTVMPIEDAKQHINKVDIAIDVAAAGLMRSYLHLYLTFWELPHDHECQKHDKKSSSTHVKWHPRAISLQACQTVFVVRLFAPSSLNAGDCACAELDMWHPDPAPTHPSTHPSTHVIRKILEMHMHEEGEVDVYKYSDWYINAEDQVTATTLRWHFVCVQ